MSLIKTMREDWIGFRKQAMTSKADAVAHATLSAQAGVLGTLIGAAQTKEKSFSPARELSDAEVVAEIKKVLDGLRETQNIIKDSAGRDDEKVKVAVEIKTLEHYMPTQMTEDEIRAFVSKSMSEGVSGMGGFMSALKAAAAGRYDGKMASAIIKEMIA